MIPEYALFPSHSMRWPGLPLLGQREDPPPERPAPRPDPEKQRREAENAKLRHEVESARARLKGIVTNERARVTAEGLRQATIQGRMYGRIWRGDPWAMARVEQIPIRMLMPRDLLAKRGRSPGLGKRLAGFVFLYAWPDRPEIYLDATLSFAELAETVAHELSHVHHQAGNWTEEMHNAWAKAFVGLG